jgi:hypothetical protein
MVPLPGDLDRLGDELDASLRRALARRRARRRVLQRSLAAAAAGALALATFAPTPLSTSERGGSSGAVRTLVTDAATLGTTTARPAAALPPF